MLLSDDHKFVFVHIPKNAGTSIQSTLGKIYPGGIIGYEDDEIFFHSTIRQIYSKFGSSIDNYFKFAVVRNPWDRMWSFYRFSLSRWPEALIGYDFKKFLLEYPSIMEKSHLPNEKFLRTQERPQLDWITIDGEIAVDFIAKYENIQFDFKYICEKLKCINTNLEWIRKVTGVNYRFAYDNETIEFIQNTYKTDIEEFGYTYE